MLITTLTDSWRFFKNNLVALSAIVLPIVVPIEIITSIYQHFYASSEIAFNEQLIPMALSMIAYPIYAIGVIFYIASTISGDKSETIRLWKLGVEFWLPYTLMNICIGIVVMVGFLLLVIPGVIFALRYAFAPFILLLNRNSPLEAMKDSWNATKGYTWTIFGGYVAISMVLFVPYAALISVFDDSSISYLVLYTVLNCLYAVLAVLYTVFSFRMFDFARNQTDN